jgi:hypothetical protein
MQHIEKYGFEVLTVVTMNVAIFWDIALCSQYVNQCFIQARHQHAAGGDPEDGSDTSLRNISLHMDYMVLYFRRSKHS